jgi:hypothetical protein
LTSTTDIGVATRLKGLAEYVPFPTAAAGSSFTLAATGLGEVLEGSPPVVFSLLESEAT